MNLTEDGMNKIDELELTLAALKMVEGTELNWGDVIKCEGGCLGIELQLRGPKYIYELALGIIEGKPVWEGDVIYNISGEPVYAKFNYQYPGQWSWNPPKPKTVMVELTVEDAEMYTKAEWCGKRLAEACRKKLEGLK